MTEQPKTLFGLAIEAADWLPANSFMMVSRVSEAPATFDIIIMEGGGQMKQWRGTMTQAWDLLSAAELTSK